MKTTRFLPILIGVRILLIISINLLVLVVEAHGIQFGVRLGFTADCSMDEWRIFYMEEIT